MDVSPLCQSSDGHSEVISILIIIEGADVSHRDEDGETARYYTAVKGVAAKYDAALTPRALAAAKLRFG